MNAAIEMVAAFALAMDRHGIPAEQREEIIDAALLIAIQRSPVPTPHELPGAHVQ